MNQPVSAPLLDRRIEQLDVTLFEHVESQMDPCDQRSLLALHAAARQVHGSFCWLEVGSYLGGSLQVLVRDPSCRSIISIDPRPASARDERGYLWDLPDNSTERMLDCLRRIPESSVEKITPLEASTADLNPTQLPDIPQLCFIDGEHTDQAALADARFCRAAMDGTGSIIFHDVPIVYRAIARFLNELDAHGERHHAYFLANTLFVIELGSAALIEAPQVADAVRDNSRGVLHSLNFNDDYRAFFNRPVFRWPRYARSSARSLRRRFR